MSMDRNLAISLVRVTEMAALTSAKYMGRGDKEGADQAAVDSMRKAFEMVDVKGTVVIGEGELDEAPMLYIGERIGGGSINGQKVDIAVDPVEGTTLVAKGLPNAIAVLAMAPEGCLLNAPDTYMNKIAVGPKAAGKVSLDASIEENLKAVAKSLNKDISDLTVTLQDRPRHYEMIKEIRRVGARIKLFEEGDVAAAVSTGFEDTGIDMFMGIGGAPEGVISAAALKCMGGQFQGRLNPMSDEETQRCRDLGWSAEDVEKLLTLEDLVKGDDVIYTATGISDGELLKGVTFIGNNSAKTYSVVMRAKTGTVRFIEAIHKLDKSEMMEELMEKHNV